MQQEEGLERALWREAEAQAICYASEEYLQKVQAVADRVRSKGK